MRYVNKAGQVITYRRNYKKEKARATGYVDLSTITLDEKKQILRQYMTSKTARDTINIMRPILPHISAWKMRALIKHFLDNEDEYYKMSPDGFLIRLF